MKQREGAKEIQSKTEPERENESQKEGMRE